MTLIMSILPSIHVSSFIKKYLELLKLSQDPEKCDRQTDSQTDRQTDTQSANHKSPLKLVGDKKRQGYQQN
ncbi:hypothetical protein DPMN_059635 [Dreissena polymorpha]|uniref:Uncharacterized protein n=1 Tax=Dreissena polymorpha TaxID=45954 RepID=A0A9D4C4C8_DREPO|nr:hypothetical protein DPMN_059635 [Dreissena polymorpha]